MPAKKSPPKKDPPKPRVYPKSVPPKNIPAKTGNAVPREVQDAQNRPPATRTTPISRNTLLPWLALGFGPVKTSGARLLCGINAVINISLRSLSWAPSFGSQPAPRSPSLSKKSGANSLTALAQLYRCQRRIISSRRRAHRETQNTKGLVRTSEQPDLPRCVRRVPCQV